MGLWQQMKDLDARGGGIMPGSTEDQDAYLTRVASSGRGTVGGAVAMLARAVLEQQRTIRGLERQLAALELQG